MMSKLRLVHLASTIFILSLQGCSPNATTVSPPPFSKNSTKSPASLPLRATIDLGVVIQGKSAEFRSWLKNQGDTSVKVAKIVSSCECLEVRLSQSHIAARERVLVHAYYDGAREPDFVGSLQIEVQLIDDNGTEVGRIDVPIEVILDDVAPAKQAT